MVLISQGTTLVPRHIGRDAFFSEDRGSKQGSSGQLKEHQYFSAAPGTAATGAPTPTQARLTHVYGAYSSDVFRTGSGFFIEEPWAGLTAESGIWVFAPDAAYTAPTLEVVLLFGVGAELFRHGLVRGFNSGRVLFNIPGLEQTPSGNRGCGITAKQISDSLGALNLKKEWSIRTIAAFSTGYRGAWLTIRNSAPHHRSQNKTGLAGHISNLSKFLIFDCLYNDDYRDPQYQKTKSTFDDVLKDLNSMLSSTCRVVANDVTQGGVTLGGRTTELSTLFASRYSALTHLQFEWRNFRMAPTGVGASTRADLTCLALMRRLAEGIADGFFTRTDVEAALLAAAASNPKEATRLRSASNLVAPLIADLANWKHGKVKAVDFSGPTKNFAQYPSNSVLTLANRSTSDLRAEAAKVFGYGTVERVLMREFVTKYQLPGWPAPDAAEFTHDSFLAEFGPEELPT